MSSRRLAFVTGPVVLLVAGLVTLLVVATGAGAGDARPAPGVLRVVGLGDSVTAGTACGCETFVQRYAQIAQARARTPVRWRDDGAGGLTTAGLLAQLGSGPVADDVRAAGVVLVTIGANDLGPALTAWENGGCDSACSTAGLPAMSRNITRIVARIKHLRGPRPAVVAVTDYWNVFEDGQVADRDYGAGFAGWSDRLTRHANTAICSAARAAGATCVDLYAPFQAGGDRALTGRLAGDGDHPNAAGHEVIARAIAAALGPLEPCGEPATRCG